MSYLFHRHLAPITLIAIALLSACAPLTTTGDSATTPVVALPPAAEQPTVAPTNASTPTTTQPAPIAVSPQITELPVQPTALPSPTPTGQLGPTNFPPDVNPLTGLTVANPAALNRRPLLVKISNSPDCVRPQSGISQADLVFEHYAEGGTTRLTALFWTHDVSRIGSVRSARLIDLELPAMYQALFAFSGASDGLKRLIAESDFFPYVLSPDYEPGHPGFYRRSIDEIRCELVEHTLFTSTERLWANADLKNINQRPTVEGMVFNSAMPAGGQPGDELVVAYVGSYAYWGYSAADGRYYRTNNGGQHTDDLTGAPVTASNVVVLFVNHVTSDIIEDFVGYNPDTGQGGNYSVQIQLWGSGDALLFRDGQAYPIKWIRPERNRPFNLTDAAGNLIAMKPGTTWYQLVPLDTPTNTTAGSWELRPPRPSPQPES